MCCCINYQNGVCLSNKMMSTAVELVVISHADRMIMDSWESLHWFYSQCVSQELPLGLRGASSRLEKLDRLFGHSTSYLFNYCSCFGKVRFPPSGGCLRGCCQDQRLPEVFLSASYMRLCFLFFFVEPLYSRRGCKKRLAESTGPEDLRCDIENLTRQLPQLESESRSPRHRSTTRPR